MSQQPLVRMLQRPAEHFAGSEQAVNAVVVRNDPACQPCVDVVAQAADVLEMTAGGAPAARTRTISLASAAITAAPARWVCLPERHHDCQRSSPDLTRHCEVTLRCGPD